MAEVPSYAAPAAPRFDGRGCVVSTHPRPFSCPGRPGGFPAPTWRDPRCLPVGMCRYLRISAVRTRPADSGRPREGPRERRRRAEMLRTPIQSRAVRRTMCGGRQGFPLADAQSAEVVARLEVSISPQRDSPCTARAGGRTPPRGCGPDGVTEGAGRPGPRRRPLAALRGRFDYTASQRRSTPGGGAPLPSGATARRRCPHGRGGGRSGGSCRGRWPAVRGRSLGRVRPEGWGLR